MLVVQERVPLYREAITACLRRQLGSVPVVAGVPDADSLKALAQRLPLTHAVMEADRVPWDVPGLIVELHRIRPQMRLIGLTATSRRPACHGVVVLPRSATPDSIAEMVQPGSDHPATFVLTSDANSDHGLLTTQQLRVLALLSLGMTAPEVASRLALSDRAVSKSKAAIFAKLGVQSQAQAVASALATGLLGPAPSLRPMTAATPSYRRPLLRAHVYQGHLPKVVTAHDHRCVAPGLHEALAGRAEVVGDTSYGAAALKLAGILTPGVIVAGELLGDGAIDHFLPDLVQAARVCCSSQTSYGTSECSGCWPTAFRRVLDRGRADQSLRRRAGHCRRGRGPTSLSVAGVVTQWRSAQHRDRAGAGAELTLREMEVLNAMADGLSTKAVARLLGVAVKTVENHKTRVFSKLGVHSQAQLLSGRAQGPAFRA